MSLDWDVSRADAVKEQSSKAITEAREESKHYFLRLKFTLTSLNYAKEMMCSVATKSAHAADEAVKPLNHNANVRFQKCLEPQ